MLDRARDLAATLKLSVEVRARTRWSRERLVALQDRAIEELAGFARERSPLYRRLYDKVDLRRTFELPIVDKATLTKSLDDSLTDRSVNLARVERHLFQGGTADQNKFLDERYAALLTGGTSGTRAIVLHDRAMAQLNVAHVLARFPAPRPRRPRPRVMMICSSDTRHVTGFYARFLPDVMARSYRVPAELALPRLVETIDEIDPDVLTTYPSTATILARERVAGRLRARPGTIWCSGEPLTKEMRRTIADAFGCPVRSSYGVTEGGQVALECKHGSMHIAEDIVRVEVVDAGGRPVPDGELGEAVLLSHLSNRIMPFLRYRLDDRIRLSTRPCPCGSAHRVIEEIAGRSATTFDVQGAKGGVVSAHGAKLQNIVLLEQDVVACQVHVRGQKVAIRVIVRPGSDPVARVRSSVDNWFDLLGADVPNLNVDVSAVAELERLPGSGKTYAVRLE